MGTMDESRAQAIDDGGKIKTGGINFNYVDTSKLDRMGIGCYSTKKPQGNNFIRIVTPNKAGAFALEIWKHSNVGGNNATFLCLDKMFGKPCPVCEHIQELKKEGTSNDVVKELYPSRRFLLFVVDTTSRETEEEGPKWFDCPVTIYKEVCTRSKDRRTGEKIDPTDPEDGRDIEFVRNDGKRTEYVGITLVKTDPIPKCWYEDLPTFTEVLLMPNPDEMKEAVLGKKSSTPDSKEDEPDKDTRKDERAEPDKNEGRESSRSRGTSDSGSRSRRSSRGEDSRSDSTNDAQAESVRKKLDEIKNRKRTQE